MTWPSTCSDAATLLQVQEILLPFLNPAAATTAAATANLQRATTLPAPNDKQRHVSDSSIVSSSL